MNNSVELINRGQEVANLPQGSYLEDSDGGIYILSQIPYGGSFGWRAVSLRTGGAWNSVYEDQKKAIKDLRLLPSGSIIEIVVKDE
jgi:hypothetical protein